MELEQLDIIEQDLIAQDNYIENIYTKKVPKPEEKSRSAWKLVGIDAMLFSISAISATLQSSVRTGNLFYILEKSLLEQHDIAQNVVGALSWTQLVLSLFAFEVGLLAVGFSKGRKSKTIRVNAFSIISLVAVVLVASLFNNFSLVNVTEQSQNIMYIVLGIITSIGATAVTYFGGENLGHTIVTLEHKRKEVDEENKESYTEWYEGGMRSYQSSRYNIRSKNYYGNVQKQNKEPEPLPVQEHEEDEEDVALDYRTSFKNNYTLKEKLEFWKEGDEGGVAFRRMFPSLNSGKIYRWKSYLNDELMDAGVLVYEKNSGNVVESNEEENWN